MDFREAEHSAMADRKDEIGAKHTRWSRPDSTAGGQGTRTPIAIAFEKGVPVREDSDLAQILAAVELDAEIPIDALAAVAEILSYVYRANQTWSGEESNSEGAEP